MIYLCTEFHRLASVSNLKQHIAVLQSYFVCACDSVGVWGKRWRVFVMNTFYCPKTKVCWENRVMYTGLG